MKKRLVSIIIGFADVMRNEDLNYILDEWLCNHGDYDDNLSLDAVHGIMDIGRKNPAFVYTKDDDIETLRLTHEAVEVIAAQVCQDGKFSKQVVRVIGYAFVDGRREEAINVLFDQSDRSDGYPTKVTWTKYVHWAERAFEIIQLVDRKWNPNRGGVGGWALRSREGGIWEAYRWARIKDEAAQAVKILESLDHAASSNADDLDARFSNLTLMNAIPTLTAAMSLVRRAIGRKDDPVFQMAERYFADGWRAKRCELGPEGMVEFTKGDQTERYRIGSASGHAIQMDMGFNDDTIRYRDEFTLYLLDLTNESKIAEKFTVAA